MLVLTGLAFLTYLTFNLFYHVTDIEVFFIPIFLLWATWSGVGAAFLLDTAATAKYVSWRPVIISLWLIIFAFMIFQLFQANRLTVSQEYTWQVHEYGLDMLQHPLPAPEKPVIVGLVGEIPTVDADVLGPTVRGEVAGLEDDRVAALLTTGHAD